MQWLSCSHSCPGQDWLKWGCQFVPFVLSTTTNTHYLTAFTHRPALLPVPLSPKCLEGLTAECGNWFYNEHIGAVLVAVAIAVLNHCLLDRVFLILTNKKLERNRQFWMWCMPFLFLSANKVNKGQPVVKTQGTVGVEQEELSWHSVALSPIPSLELSSQQRPGSILAISLHKKSMAGGTFIQCSTRDPPAYAARNDRG